MSFQISNKLLTILTIFVSIIFIGKAFYNLLNYGSDFETSYILGKSFWSGVDVFSLENKNPYYPHIWYIALFPIIHFEFEIIKIIFFVLNLFFFYGSIFILKTNFKLNNNESKVLIIMSVISTPFTNLLAIGNISLLVLFFILVYYFYFNYFLKGLALSIALVKYNISFLFILLPFLQNKKKVAIIFIILNLISVLFYYGYLGINNPLKFFDPIISMYNTVGQQINEGDGGINLGLFNLHNLMIDLKLSKFYYIVFGLITMLISYLIITKKNISKNKLLILILLITSGLIYHALYDFIILVPVLAYIIKNRDKLKYKALYFFTIILIFYLFKINTLFNMIIQKEFFSGLGLILIFLSFIFLTFFENE